MITVVKLRHAKLNRPIFKALTTIFSYCLDLIDPDDVSLIID